ncbi:unnamed protein product [Diatraea saccharalis]|uniref:FLYWCH-type domain-containing protein n=1 Tax=Diatraea saccharalis TaxID=40085 RepID=A0A9N9R131_9NEOP|nr:unnamed protein product [Diatraea saccharalis]
MGDGNHLQSAYIIPPKFRKTKGNGRLLYKGYTYSWRNRKKNGNYWTCSSHQKKEIHFITSKKGHKLLVYEQYTYAQNCISKSRVSWACSSRCSKKCCAQVALTNDGELFIINKEHSHPPPIFYVNEKGDYVRVSDKQLKKMVNEENDEHDLNFLDQDQDLIEEDND